jgi:hypothetical protein
MDLALSVQKKENQLIVSLWLEPGSEFGFSGLGCAQASLLTARRLTRSKLELRLKMLGVNARVHNYTSNKPLHSINYVVES